MKKSQKVAEIFLCEYCDYKCCKKSDFNKHLSTRKHINRTKLNDLEQKNSQKSPNFVCKNCDKIYKVRNSLWYHQQKCTLKQIQNDTNKDKCNINEKRINNNIIDKEIIMTLIKDNAELKNVILEQQNNMMEKQNMMMIEQQNLMMKVIENGTNNIINSHNTNSNNKSFNLQFFLNETCKDAMNITDFVDSIKLQLTDLENVGELGYVKGISNIITSNLKALDVTQRPIHCTDKKRETLYIKDENKWEKEDERKNKLRKAIKKIANKNISLIQEFKKKYPDCIKSTSKFSDQYNKIIVEAMGGPGNNDEEKEDKIIKNISDITTLNKNEGI